MRVYLYFVCVVILISVVVTYIVQRNRGRAAKWSREYIGKYHWIFQQFIFPLMAICILILQGFRAFCLALLTVVIINIICRKLLNLNRKFGARTAIILCVSVGLIVLSYSANEPLWIQIRYTLFGSILAIWSLSAAIFNAPKFSPLYLSPSKPDIGRKAWRIVNFELAAFGIAVVILNEYFRQSTNLETWAVFNAYGLLCLIAIFAVFTMPMILKFQSEA